jgi:4-hydroxy-4-methyl-2-oxoglutarate aldolase
MRKQPDLNSDVVALGQRHAAATIYEATGKRGEVGPGIMPLDPAMNLSGLAVTVRCPIGDARGIWTAIATAPAGSVIVVDNGGSAWSTAIGATSVRAAIRRGLAGFVLNGAVRDSGEIRALGLPVFAAGRSVRGTQKSHPGWHGLDLAIGAAVIRPGDLVVGDGDGVVVVPREDFATLPKRLEAQTAREAAIDARIEAGEDVRDVLGLR